MLLLAAVLGFFAVRGWLYSQQQQELKVALEATAGIHVTELNRDGGVFFVRGLRDPLAVSVVDVAKSVDVPAERLNVSTQPFQSLQPEILSARAAQMFGQPGSTRFSVAGSTLVVEGDAPWSWQRTLRSRFGGLAGVESLDTSGLTAADRQQFVARIESIEPRNFYFQSGVEFLQGNDVALREYAAELSELQRNAARFD